MRVKGAGFRVYTVHAGFSIKQGLGFYGFWVSGAV
jgi:hypothetical protein